MAEQRQDSSRKVAERNQSTAAGEASGRKTAKSSFRPDIEGLRGVAVVAVILYHCGISLFGGGYVGVDVFFVISGFLITGMLLREIEKSGRLSFARFYGGRAKRLLPALAIVLAFVSIGAWLILAPVRRAATAGDIIASGLYVNNWRLASQAVNYFEAGLEASPVEHLWTLGVEEQFYLVWPALLLIVTWWLSRKGKNVRPILAGTLTVVTVASLAYCIYLTQAEAGRAYFSTFTRVWELAIGGLIAVALASGRRVSRRMGTVLAILGMLAILFAIFRYSDRTMFPGYAALAPTLGAAAVIIAGTAGSRYGPLRLLDNRVMRHLGKISYTWYLWHWPLLVFAGALWGNLAAPTIIAVVLLSYLLTVATHVYIEEPLRRSPTLTKFPGKALAMGAVLTVAAVALGVVVHATVPDIKTAPTTKVSGAKQLEASKAPQKKVNEIRPAPRDATQDRGVMKKDGCLVQAKGTKSPSCVYGDPHSDKTVVLYGDSHAMQWFPAINKVAKKKHWKLVGLTKSGCPPVKATVYNTELKRRYTECNEWQANAEKRIKDLKPDMIITTQRADYAVMHGNERVNGPASAKIMTKDAASNLRKMKKLSDRVVAIKDDPHPSFDVPDCVSKHPKALDKCVLPKGKALGYSPVVKDAAQQVGGVDLIDPTPKLCQKGKCPAVIGNALVYRNGDHLTATFVKSLSGWLAGKLPSL
ncbi:acyltransferase family protein [Spelaeicoccus albus]|uniref:Peptidoglycan/LPS O-acetylase OafA/YrhL n=1 Tax=Spelaeicoccus albus TaxID=1280376 RepID=A0A7Z0A8G6_9MICO|nr:acyltransferase family protein [Spelaeicoccus albus]NYI66349.1 peptidoglycan/LPS O-acetylase OafA/YrhL [Spelaeicoccus albus]